MTVSDNSPLIAARSRGHLDIVNELLKHGADVNTTDYCSLQGMELMSTSDITTWKIGNDANKLWISECTAWKS